MAEPHRWWFSGSWQDAYCLYCNARYVDYRAAEESRLFDRDELEACLEQNPSVRAGVREIAAKHGISA